MDEKIKVTDKRMFDSSGELRSDTQRDYQETSPEAASTEASNGPESPAEGVEDATPGGKPPGPPAPPRSEEVAEEPKEESIEAEPEPVGPSGGAGKPGGLDELPAPEVMDLIGLLAQPIAMFLGDAPLPDGGSAENLALARYHIDLLELLQEKTQGNLSSQESQVLGSLLYQLRMRYVEKAG